MRVAALLTLLAAAPPPAAPPTPRSAPKVTALEAAPRGLDVRGRLVRAVRFVDAAGENVVALSERRRTKKGAIELHALHAVKTKTGWRPLRRLKDWLSDCEFDLVAGFEPDAFAVTDVDRDGHAEVTFAYTLGCTSDVSPNPLKLMVLTRGDKYAVRGTTRVRLGPKAVMGGEPTFDPKFDAAPEGLRAHAAATWARLTR